MSFSGASLPVADSKEEKLTFAERIQKIVAANRVKIRNELSEWLDKPFLELKKFRVEGLSLAWQPNAAEVLPELPIINTEVKAHTRLMREVCKEVKVDLTKDEAIQIEEKRIDEMQKKVKELESTALELSQTKVSVLQKRVELLWQYYHGAQVLSEKKHEQECNKLQLFGLSDAQLEAEFLQSREVSQLAPDDLGARTALRQKLFLQQREAAQRASQRFREDAHHKRGMACHAYLKKMQESLMVSVIDPDDIDNMSASLKAAQERLEQAKARLMLAQSPQQSEGKQSVVKSNGSSKTQLNGSSSSAQKPAQSSGQSCWSQFWSIFSCCSPKNSAKKVNNDDARRSLLEGEDTNSTPNNGSAKKIGVVL